MVSWSLLTTAVESMPGIRDVQFVLLLLSINTRDKRFVGILILNIVNCQWKQLYWELTENSFVLNGSYCLECKCRSAMYSFYIKESILLKHYFKMLYNRCWCLLNWSVFAYFDHTLSKCNVNVWSN